ncbi:hypothetical protein GCM10009602_53440 [Nocardiopsis tropica]
MRCGLRTRLRTSGKRGEKTAQKQPCASDPALVRLRLGRLFQDLGSRMPRIGGRRSHPTTPLLRCRFTDSPARDRGTREQWLHDITESTRSVPLGRLIRPLRVCGRADPGGLRRLGSAP